MYAIKSTDGPPREWMGVRINLIYDEKIESTNITLLRVWTVRGFINDV
jgi:hypothetical protein